MATSYGAPKTSLDLETLNNNYLDLGKVTVGQTTISDGSLGRM
jgi:hypothetical protein